jgi:hypothetical protein
MLRMSEVAAASHLLLFAAFVRPSPPHQGLVVTPFLFGLVGRLDVRLSVVYPRFTFLSLFLSSLFLRLLFIHLFHHFIILVRRLVSL